MRKRVISFYGVFLIVIGVSMFLPLAVALVKGELDAARALGIAIAVALVPGIAIKQFTGKAIEQQTMKQTDSYFIVATSWLLASVIASIPFVIQGSIADPVEAFFEMCSGFSTTGSTILTDIESVPSSLLLWRSETQWLGGMGIIVLVVALVPNFGIKAQNVASAETPGPTVTKLTSRFSGTAQKLYLLYIFFTVLLIVLLMFGGMSLYDAVNHSFTTMATGGFSTHSESIAYYHSAYISWVLTVFMVIAGTNFNLFYDAASGGIKKMFGDQEFKLYLTLVIGATLIIAVDLLFQGGYDSIFKSLTDSAFQVSTIISTTGYATQNFDLWPSLCKMIFIILMFTGACSSSTAGGVKVVRVLTIFKMIKREVRIRIHDTMVDDIVYNGRKVSAQVLTFIGYFVTTFIFTVFVGYLLVSITSGNDLVTDFTAVLTCISNVGPGLAKVGPVCNFHFMPDITKFILALIMIIGRLELTTFLIIFTREYWNPYRTRRSRKKRQYYTERF
jgi:trk system potassium uptake protein TrkH